MPRLLEPVVVPAETTVLDAKARISSSNDETRAQLRRSRPQAAVRFSQHVPQGVSGFTSVDLDEPEDESRFESRNPMAHVRFVDSVQKRLSSPDLAGDDAGLFIMDDAYRGRSCPQSGYRPVKRALQEAPVEIHHERRKMPVGRKVALVVSSVLLALGIGGAVYFGYSTLMESGVMGDPDPNASVSFQQPLFDSAAVEMPTDVVQGTDGGESYKTADLVAILKNLKYGEQDVSIDEGDVSISANGGKILLREAVDDVRPEPLSASIRLASMRCAALAHELYDDKLDSSPVRFISWLLEDGEGVSRFAVIDTPIEELDGKSTTEELVRTSSGYVCDSTWARILAGANVALLDHEGLYPTDVTGTVIELGENADSLQQVLPSNGADVASQSESKDGGEKAPSEDADADEGKEPETPTYENVAPDENGNEVTFGDPEPSAPNASKAPSTGGGANEAVHV